MYPIIIWIPYTICTTCISSNKVLYSTIFQYPILFTQTSIVSADTKCPQPRSASKRSPLVFTNRKVTASRVTLRN